MSEVVVRFALSVFPFGRFSLLRTWAVSPFPSTFASLTTFPLVVSEFCSRAGRDIAQVLENRNDPLDISLATLVQDFCMSAREFCSNGPFRRTPHPSPESRRVGAPRVQLGGPPGHERRIEGSRSTSIGEVNISCVENLTCSHGPV